MPISNASIRLRPMPVWSARASVDTSAALFSLRFRSRIMCASVSTASARVVASQLWLSVYVMPGVHLIAGVGHQVSSALLPPIRSTGDWSGARLRISCTNTGLIARGLDPVYSRTA